MAIARRSLLGSAVVLVLAACGESPSGPQGTRTSPFTLDGVTYSDGPAIFASAYPALPLSSLADWVTYADAVATFTVGQIMTVDPTHEELATGQGIIGRRADIGQLTVLWRRPQAPDMPATFETEAGGWSFDATTHVRRELRDTSFAWLTEGERYLAPLVQVDFSRRGAPAWEVLTGALLGMREGRTVTPPDVTATDTARTALLGKTPEEVGALLGEATPHTGADFSLDPIERMQALQG